MKKKINFPTLLHVVSPTRLLGRMLFIILGKPVGGKRLDADAWCEKQMRSRDY